MPEHNPVEDLLSELVVQDFLAQQDVTRVADPRDEQPEMGELENLIMNLIEGADPTMGVASGIAGLRPDDPNLKLQLALGLLTGGSLGGLLKAGGRGIGSLFRGMTKGPTAQLLGKADDLIGGVPRGTLRKLEDETAESSLLQEVRADRAAREGRTLRTDSDIAKRRRDLAGIRESIFEDLVQKDPFGEADEAHRRLIEQIENLALKRGGN